MESLYNGGTIKIKYKSAEPEKHLLVDYRESDVKCLTELYHCSHLVKAKWDKHTKQSDQVCQLIRNTRENRPGTEENLFWKKYTGINDSMFSGKNKLKRDHEKKELFTFQIKQNVELYKS